MISQNSDEGGCWEVGTYTGAGGPETWPGDQVTQGVAPAAPAPLLALTRPAGLLVLPVTLAVRLGHTPGPGPGSSHTRPVAPHGGPWPRALLELQG